ncbi:MAG: prolyl oligopeptidase family serine peptidase [Phycisphaerales bacterium]
MAKRCVFHLSVLIVACAPGVAQVAFGQSDEIRPGENLVTQGLPPIPASLADEVRRYTESHSASLADWHPTERSILISTRFANTAQIHCVKQPGGARTQLTFFDEPIGDASYEPGSGRCFLFTKDMGGNDPRVPRSEAEQMVEQVAKNGTPVWYLMAKNEGHGFRKKENADFQFYATVLFVRQFLLGSS